MTESAAADCRRPADHHGPQPNPAAQDGWHPSSGRALNYTLRLPGSRSLVLGDRPLLMGILYITPESFSDGGRHLDPEAALDRALTMLEEGADLLDLAAESTRP